MYCKMRSCSPPRTQSARLYDEDQPAGCSSPGWLMQRTLPATEKVPNSPKSRARSGVVWGKVGRGWAPYCIRSAHPSSKLPAPLRANLLPVLLSAPLSSCDHSFPGVTRGEKWRAWEESQDDPLRCEHGSSSSRKTMHASPVVPQPGSVGLFCFEDRQNPVNFDNSGIRRIPSSSG